jgi:hypothetical protein
MGGDPIASIFFGSEVPEIVDQAIWATQTARAKLALFVPKIKL